MTVIEVGKIFPTIENISFFVDKNSLKNSIDDGNQNYKVNYIMNRIQDVDSDHSQKILPHKILEYNNELMLDYTSINTSNDFIMFTQYIDLRLQSEGSLISKYKELIKMQFSNIFKNYNLARIEEISHFEDNWDDNSSKKINQNVINISRQLIESLDFNYYISPSNRDSIIFPFRKEKESLLIEIFSEKVIFVRNSKTDEGICMIEKGVIVNDVLSRIMELISTFYGKG